MVKSNDYTSEGPEFHSQQPHGGSQPSVMRSNSGLSEDSSSVLMTHPAGPVIRGQGEEELKPGEVRLAGCGSSIHLGEDGVSLTGQVYINGQTLEELIAAIIDGA